MDIWQSMRIWEPVVEVGAHRAYEYMAEYVYLGTCSRGIHIEYMNIWQSMCIWKLAVVKDQYTMYIIQL